MKQRERATRAVLAALAAGAAPADALRAGANSTEDVGVSEAFRGAADDLRGDAFRRDVITRVALDPPVVGLLLARAPKEALAPVAATALQAMERVRRSWKNVLRAVYLAFLALAELGTAAVLATFVLKTLPAAESTQAVTAGAVLALLAILLLASGLALDRGKLRLETPQLMYWLVAAEQAALPPGAVLEVLMRSASFADELRLSRLSQRLRGAASVAEAMTTWAERGGLRGPLSKVVGLVADGEEPATAAARVARIAASLHPPAPAVRPYVSAAALLVVAAAGLIAGAIFQALAHLGGQLS